MIQRREEYERGAAAVAAPGRVEVARRTEVTVEEESVGHALSRVAEASQTLLADRLDLLKVEAQATLEEKVEAAKAAGVSLALLGAGAVVLAAGWATLMVGAGMGLATEVGAGWAATIIGGAHVLIGLGVLGAALLMQRHARAAAKGEAQEGRRG
jgi:hypothetical protein